MASPIESFLGFAGIGFGSVLLYAAVSNKKPFADIIHPAISGGLLKTKATKSSYVAADGQTVSGAAAGPAVPATAADGQVIGSTPYGPDIPGSHDDQIANNDPQYNPAVNPVYPTWNGVAF